MAIDQQVQEKSLENVGIDNTAAPAKGQAAAEAFTRERNAAGTRRFLELLSDDEGSKTIPLSQEKRNKLAESGSDDTGVQDRLKFRLTEYDLITQESGFDTMNQGLKKAYRTEVISALGPNYADIISGPPPMSNVRRSEFADSIIKDGRFSTELTARMHDLDRNSKFDPSPKDINRAIAQLRAQDPTKYTTDDLARADAYTELKTAHQQKLQDDIEGSVTYATQQVLKSNIEGAHVAVNEKGAELDARAEEIAKEQGEEAGEGISRRLARRWDSPNAFDMQANRFNNALRRMNPFMTERNDGIGTTDYEVFRQEGLTQDFLTDRGVPLAEAQRLLNNPELRREYEKNIGKDLLMRRLGGGPLNEEQMRSLESAAWMGATPAERVDTIQEMFVTRQGFRDLEQAARDGGMLDSNFWAKARDAAAKGALPGGIAALLLMFVTLPWGVIGTAAGAGGGALLRRMGQAGKESRRFAA